MKHLSNILLLCALLALCAASCKPSEQNYKAAYERAVAGGANDADEDSTIYKSMRRDLRRVDMMVDGDTIEVKTQFVAITEGGGGMPEYIKPYCVVAGQFKQVFNAKSMRERLVDNGYPGAFVVQTREPYYFVVAGSMSDVHQAMALAERLRNDPDLKLKAPLPFILQPAQHRR